MIIELKQGEIIKEGDFYTSDGEGFGTRFSVGCAIGHESVGGIFREIPDELTLPPIGLGEAVVTADASQHVHTKETIKAFSLWMLEE